MHMTEILTEFRAFKKLVVKIDLLTDLSLLLTDWFWRTDNWSKL